MWETGDRFDAVKAAELALLDSEVRRDPDRVRELLHPEFVEIGRSGRRWTRSATIAALESEHERVAPETDEWSFNEVSLSLVLVTYRITGGAGSSRHASLWDVSGAVPMIRYHQGTLIRSDDVERISVDRPEIVCICGSARFLPQMRDVNRDLTLSGVIVLAPGEAEGVVSVEQKTVLDALHLRKIDLADRVLVVNPGGYIGESAGREIAYARAAGKAVSFTDPA
ncbi:nuclear transport factor 2 family protein [Microbacterium lacticum]|uniref:DUF4440 domain-containing protein n=3 Tax=Microbacterium lacticum TaxID=33885 RepID=A0A4Y3UNA5_9MICO|nr:hypothetical protein FHX68_1896 [Microbacterium lacticum]GEB96186.1 hypothetical protein MLA01_24050 [Microbacterium lacticum]GGI72691.1 hypothetical protein GCM10009724_24660 [Microbacterium lacticum]